MRWWSGFLLWMGFLVLMAGKAGSSEAKPAVPDGCPALPQGAQLISGLTSGQAVASGESTMLRFSSKVFACGEWSNEASSTECWDWWNFSLTVPSSAVSPGSYALSELQASFGGLFVVGTPEQGDGCSRDSCRMSTKGTGSVAVADRGGTLTIHAVNDRCITGELSGFKDPVFPDAPDYSGSFFALRCD